MKINSWSVDRLAQLGIAPKDARELRVLGVQLQLLEEMLLRETAAMAEIPGDVEPPLTNNEKRWQRLMNQVWRILNRYPGLSLTDGENGGIALYKDDELLPALEAAASGDHEALAKVPATTVTW